MQFIYSHPYISGFITLMLLNFIIKEITKSKSSPIGWMLASIVSLIGQACSPFSGAVDAEVSDNYYYGKSGEQIRYSPMGNWFELGNTKVEADAASFTPVAREFAKDKDHIFFKEHIIDEEVDYSSFSVVERLVFDKDHVYVPVDFMAYSIRDTLDASKKMYVIEGADPETYSETEDWVWGKDDKNWFYGYKKIAVDYESFSPINEKFCKDNYQVYLRKSFELVPCEIDPQRFKTLNERYVTDAKFIYDFVPWSDGEEVNQLNKFSYESFESIDFLHEDYLLFDNQVIYDGALIEGADRESFEVFEGDAHAYAKDAHQLFCNGRTIDSADRATFELYDNIQYARDKNYVYYWGVRMEGVDLATFGPIDDDGWIYGDKNHTYVGDEIREDS
ncbi:MAG: DKNYY domain-containing protein [Reichenbachiella sp.]|uniref:DKNYY domain-containing protein n=1 Tax=Reichenbachiella sp. TaxID=2184521 RepID=UPI003299EF2F